MLNGAITYYVGNHFEWRSTTSNMTRYYYADGQRVAMRQGSTVYYLLGDHLGSTTLTVTGTGTKYAEQRYYPWGGTRWPDSPATPTARRFTGQIEDAGIGLYFYNARYYDPYLNRFISPDTIIPDPANPQSLNRYSYCLNNPLKYKDPSGHFFITALALGVAGGAIGGAVYGYGVQVADNLDQGMNLGQALTTDIDPGKIGEYTLMGSGVGGAGGLVVGAVGEVALALGLVKTAGAGTTAVTAVCGGDCSDEITAANNTGLGTLSRAREFGIQSFDALRDAVRGNGLHRHHIIEQRFAPSLGLNQGQMPSVVLTPEEHQRFTKLWHDAIPYINSGQSLNTLTATREQIWLAAQKIYANYPALLEAAYRTLFGQ